MSLSFPCPYRCVFCVPVRDIPCPQWCEFSPRSSPTGGLRDALADLSLPLRALLHAVAGEDGQPVLHVHPVHRPHQICRERPHVRAEETQRLVQLLHAGVAQRAEASRLAARLSYSQNWHQRLTLTNTFLPLTNTFLPVTNTFCL